MNNTRHPIRRAVPRSAEFSAPPARKRRRKRDEALDLLRRLKARRQYRRDLRRQRIAKGTRHPQKRKKFALALGVSAMSLNTVGMGTGMTFMSNVASAQDNVSEDPRHTRIAANKINVSDEMKLALIEEEGIHHTVYADPVGLLTVGVGHLVQPEDDLRLGQTLSDQRIAKFLEQDLAQAERAVERLVGDLPLFQHEFDALVDLVFNVGEGNVSAENSPLLNQAIAKRDYIGIAEQLAYHNAVGQRLKGLEFRSDRREAIFMKARYDNPRKVELVRT